MRRVSILTILIVAVLIMPVSATIINVPDDYPTIQEGINASSDGDTVLVQPGTYVENINFNGHNIVLGSLFIITGDTSYISQTVIDGNSSGPVVIFESGENSSSIITGFTIQNGSADLGGGVFCENSSPTLLSCTFTRNNAPKGGGTSCISHSSPTLINCVYDFNRSVSSNSPTYGAGIYCNRFSTITNNIISENSANKGGGIYFLGTNSTFINNTLCRNLAVSSGGGIYCNYSDVLVTNTILWCDSAQEEGNEIHLEGTSSPIFTYNDIQGGWDGEGNIDADPLFVDAENYDFHLMSGSPCIDAGDPDSPLDPDGTIADIGAFYFDQSTSVADDHLVPVEFHLGQNYPNPFNASTIIQYTLPKTSDVTIDTYDLLGRKVETLVNKHQPAGYHQVIWNADDVSSGIYFYRITAGEFSQSRKMILLK